MTPDAYLANAQRMFLAHGGSPDASASRAIAHAAYYAVYHHAVAVFGLDPRDKKVTNHGAVRDRILNYTGPNAGLLEAQAQYVSLLKGRLDADYYLVEPVGALAAVAALRRAERVFQAAGITPAIV